MRALQLVCVIDQPTASTIAEDGTVLDDTEQLPVSTAEKLSFFNETRHAFGRSALLLSGGATLGLYHIGVCKSLHENSLLPRVLSGSSVGSIICAMVGTRTDEELTDLFSPESNVIKLNFFVRPHTQPCYHPTPPICSSRRNASHICLLFSFLPLASQRRQCSS